MLDGLLVHGADTVDLDAPLILYRNRERAVKNLDRRAKWGLPLFVYLAVCEGALARDWMVGVVIASVFAICWLLVYLWVRRDHLRATRPILELRKEGLVIQSWLTNFELIPWDEVKEVQAFDFIHRGIGVKPNNLRKTLLRGSVPTRILCVLNAAGVPLCRLFGYLAAPINIPEEYLPLSAIEVAEQINIRMSRVLELRGGAMPGLVKDHQREELSDGKDS